ncbi:MAG: histidine phosphatase family protein [Candidatus Thorarchaeota archaeon]|jgi:broad specificity phosphatase PhoE
MFELIQDRDMGRDYTSRTTVYVIVHAEPAPQNPGHITEQGKNQVLDLARSRVVTGVAQIYSAPSEPALETSGMLRKEFDAPVIVDDGLSELSFGTVDFSDSESLEVFAKMWSDFSYSPNEGESLDNATYRIRDCVNSLGAQHPDDAIAIVTHPLVSAIMYSLVVGKSVGPRSWLEMGYASCAAYEYSKNQWGLIMPPDDTYLEHTSSVKDFLAESVVAALEKLDDELKEEE